MSVISKINELKLTLSSDPYSPEITKIPFNFNCNIAELQNGRAKMIYPMVGWMDMYEHDNTSESSTFSEVKTMIIDRDDDDDAEYSITEINDRGLQISKYEVSLTK